MATDPAEVMDFEPDESLVEDTPDGGAIVTLGPDMPDQETGFYENIADSIDSSKRDQLATSLLKLIDFDKESRKKRDEEYAEGIKRTGLGKEAPGGATFNGASRVVHPMLMKGCIDFGARTIAELFPPNGPVKDYIPGEPTDAQMRKAKRKVTYMNWQFVTQMPEFRAELEQVLSQVPLGGSQYIRLAYDSRKRRPVPVSVMIDDVYLPYAASSFYTAERVTYVEHITRMEYDGRVKEGIYLDIDTSVPSMPPEVSKAEEASMKVEGKTQNWYNEDGLRDMYEVMCYADLEDEYGEQPYLVALCSHSHKIASIVRNWDQAKIDEEVEDESELPKQEPMYWMVEFGFIPWRGVYHIGLGQLIGGLSGAATGALRALLDSGHINNFPSLLRLKGINFSGQSIEMNVTSITDVEGGIGVDADIRKLMMAVPYNQTSPVLLNLLGFLSEQGSDVVRTVFDKLGDISSPNMPVGTTLALIEQAMKVFNAIHLRLVSSMTHVVQILQRINRMYLTNEQIKKQTGKQMALVEDFDDPQDVIPTADPEVFSDVQRWAQIQLVTQRATGNPLYNQRKVEELILGRTKLPDALSLLLPEQKPEEMNAVNENMALTMGRPVAAFPEQDHLAHIQVLLDFMMSPLLGMLQIIAPTFLPGALNHLKDHMTMWYVTEAIRGLEKSSGTKIDKLMKPRDPKTRAELDRTLATLSPIITERAAKLFAKIPQAIQQAQQVLASMQPQMTDPMVAATMQIEQLKAQINQKKIEADAQKTQLVQDRTDRRSAEERQADLQKEQLRQSGEDRRQAEELRAKEQMNTSDNITAMTIAHGEMESGEKVALSTGTGINPGN
jgi:hypothetical protein